MKLCGNGRYWQARYYALDGRRHTRGLGAKADLSRRQALKRCVEIGHELSTNPATATALRAPALGEYLARYLASRTDLKASTRYLYGLAGRYLTTYFGDAHRIDQITRAAARDWRTALKAGELAQGDRPKRGRDETTACDYCKYAKAIFKWAVDDDLLEVNPFDKLRSHDTNLRKDWHHVSAGDLEKLIEAAPGHGWKAMIALCRLAGLRRGEAVALPWSAVEWQGRKLTVIAQKTATTSDTGGKRTVPVEPRLHDVLLAAFEAAPDGASRTCDINPANLRRDFGVIQKRAGLAAWPKPFQAMRKNRTTEWACQYPQHVVSEWMGHDEDVSAEFDLRVPEELYAKAAAVDPATDLAQNVAQTPRRS